MFVTPGSRAGRKRSPSSVGFAHRTQLSANLTYYVSTTGSNSNTGLSATTPFASAQHAYNIIVETLDLAGHEVTIQMADGAYDDTNGIIDTSTGPWTGGGDIVWQGNLSNQTLVTVTSTVSPTGAILFNNTVLPGIFTAQFMKWTTNAIGTDNFVSGYVKIRNIDIGSVGLAAHIADAVGAIVDVAGNYTISGSGPIHLYSSIGGAQCYYGLVATAVTLTGTPNFSNSFIVADLGGIVYLTGIGTLTFSGTTTGARFTVSNLGIIRDPSNNLTRLPGNAAGTITTGSEYGNIVDNSGPPSGLVSALPPVASMSIGSHAFVTNSTLTLAAGLGNIVVGTTVGGTSTPVYNDGTNWRIG